LPVAHAALDGRAQVRAGAVQAEVRVPQQRRACGPSLLRQDVAARSAARWAAASTSSTTPRLERRGQFGARLWSAGHRCGEPRELTVQQIADVLGVGRSSVYRALWREGAVHGPTSGPPPAGPGTGRQG
jgi:hypothetical protein